MAIVRPDQSSGGGGGGTVKSVKATDTSIVVAGTATDPTIATGTLDVIAADHPPAADWSNNAHKITGLANGTAATDAAAYGQLPMLLLYDFTVSVAQASVDTNVDGALAGLFPTSYRALQVFATMRTDEATFVSTVNMIANNDTGANYDRAALATSASGSPILVSVAAANAWALGCPGSSASANFPGVLRMSFPDYAGSTLYKVGEDFGGMAPGSTTAGQYQVLAQSFTYRSTSTPITRFKWAPATAGKKFVGGCRFMVWALT